MLTKNDRRSNRYHSKVLLIIRPITLQHVAVKRYWPKVILIRSGSFLVDWGVTIAYFHVSGKRPSKNEIGLLNDTMD